ncbi:MAG TPA: tRNA pseudouridine(55) synthase TruB [Bacteroidota bacterium]
MKNATTLPATLARELHLADGDVLLIDKPKGWTSFDVVHRVRRLFRVKKAGHAGTLDPLATGLLIVCTGRMTRETGRFMAAEKEYLVGMRLGARTPSFDAETPVCETRSTDDVTDDRIRAALAGFLGTRRQVPPMWSAVKVHGERLYRYAQRGQEVPRPAREVTIQAIIPVRIAIPDVEMTVVCSKGTYIRSLVDDIGGALGCGAFVSALRRTRIGAYAVEDAATMEDLVRYAQEAGVQTV